MDKELIMCIVMYVIIFLWIFICPVVVNSGEDKRKRSRRMTENKDIPQFVACGLEMGNCGYQIPYDMAEHERIIRADAIDEIETKLVDIILGNEEFTDCQKQEISLCLECVIEQLKEQK